MPCNCINKTCIPVYVSPCDADIYLGLTADTTGEYLFLLEFAGAYSRFTIDFTAGDNIVIKNVVNENYKHELQIFKPNGNLLNNICYILSASTIITPII